MQKWFILLLFCHLSVFAAESQVTLIRPKIDQGDYASLQRGARTYMNYCSGCHSLKFARLDALAKGIGIVDESGALLQEAVKENLLFTGEKIESPILAALPKALGEKWFGITPPDLSLVTRSRGADWVYTYLHAFYYDSSKPWMVNNLVYPDVAMPHILGDLEGVKHFLPDANTQAIRLNQLKIVEKGHLSAKEYDEMVQDLVNFLIFVGEPVSADRKYLGGWVLIFLSVFLVFAYLLYREYWKDI